MPELLEALLERQRAPEEPAAAAATTRRSRRSLRTLLDLPAAEQRELEAAIRRLGRQIHGARGRRLKRDRTGRISLPHTLRRNLAYEGVPFEPVLRRRRESRPRLVVLCDVSLSTRNIARFWLHLVYRLQDLFSKVRTFVFVADLVEVTAALRGAAARRRGRPDLLRRASSTSTRTATSAGPRRRSSPATRAR